jgi:hypothetical protein
MEFKQVTPGNLGQISENALANSLSLTAIRMAWPVNHAILKCFLQADDLEDF